MKVAEELYHFIWNNKLFREEDLLLENKEHLQIIRTGRHNTDAGPDFFNARIKIGETLWAGNVEIHLKSSDWIKHGHHKDKAYDNVILQVVGENDMPVFRTDGEKIPTAELKIEKKMLEKYRDLKRNKPKIACASDFGEIDEFIKSTWLNALWAERMERKSEAVRQIFEYTRNSWSETFYISLARSFGAKINAEPFELLAKSLPAKILAKHKNSLLQTEALLFGQAGFLTEEPEDEYQAKLKKEYQFLRQKYRLIPLQKHLWKFLRLRPPGFPTLRIAQFAELVHQSSHLFSRILEYKKIADLKKSFHCQASSYWNTHYTFGKESKNRPKKLGKSAIHSILLNSVIPMLFLYGKERKLPEFTDKAAEISESLPPEKNKIIRLWQDLDAKTENALQTQAYIRLFNEYCQKRLCTRCRIGGKILSAQT